MFNEWGADGIKVDHMCQGPSCGTGAQGHMIAVEFQQPTIERWVSAIAAVNKTESVLFQVRARGIYSVDVHIYQNLI